MMNPTEHILKHFEAVSSIPRGTKDEAGIRRWLIEWATASRFGSRTDAMGNLVIQVPASAGRESEPVLILQGHMDMVWQKTPESTHDFTRDPIRLIRDGDWIHAADTTLGADNGIAIALMMALVEDDAVSHPPLELLLTVEEELGLEGAHKLDPALLTGNTLINLDSEKEGVFTVGCAGGGTVYVTLPVTWNPQTADESAFVVNVGGLRGGHSGEDINKNRANANKVMARVLDAIQRATPIRLAALKGGTARNAIPRDTEAAFVCNAGQSALCRQAFEEITADIRAELALTEPGLFIKMTGQEKSLGRAIRPEESRDALRLITALPHGVASMSTDVPNFVETSNNIGIVELKEDGLEVVSNHRSAILSKLEEISRRVESLAWLAGAQTRRTALSHPWQANMESALLKKCQRVYEQVIGTAPTVELSHAGLECGILSDRCGGLDTISFGPTIENPHSPDERLHVPSLAGTWKFLKAILES